MYDGHAVNLWWKSTRVVVADEPQSDSQGLYREVQARRKDSEIEYFEQKSDTKAYMADKWVKSHEFQKATVTRMRKSDR